MKLNAEQVERLYAFTRQHYVEYYDLQTEKKLPLKEIIFGYSTVAGSINIPIQLVFHLNGKHFHELTLVLFSFLLVLLYLTIYIVLVLIPSKTEDYLKATYPEYELLQKL